MLKLGCCFPPLLKFLAMRLVVTPSIYQNLVVYFLFDFVIFWLLVAVHFISELTKFELINTIFEHNYIHLSPTLRINVFKVNAVLSARYPDIAPTTNMGVARGGTWAMVTKYI